jgi:hypothetical protein
MRAQGKGNAACWDCRLYVVINGVPMCCATAQNVPILVKPMKCDKRETKK